MNLLLDQVKNNIVLQGKKWVAKETWVSKLDDEWLRLMFTPPREKPSAKISSVSAVSPVGDVGSSYPPVVDWRDMYGTNWTTPVKNQYTCPACTVFGSVGAMEARLMIMMNNPDYPIDLSEALVYFWGLHSPCVETFAPYNVYVWLQEYGACDEECAPWLYPPVEPPVCDDYDERLITIIDFFELQSYDDVKTAIANRGPISVAMMVHDDFLYYSGGIYEPTVEHIYEYHYVCLVGYNDIERYWIMKNSWGADWGEDGFGRIGYDVSDFLLPAERFEVSVPLIGPRLPGKWPPEIPLPIETMSIDWEFGGNWLDAEKWEKSSDYFSDRISDACLLYLKIGYSLDIGADENGCSVTLLGELVDIVYLIDFVSKIQRAFELYLSGDFSLPGNFEYRYGV